jgi:hypothetical protein
MFPIDDPMVAAVARLSAKRRTTFLLSFSWPKLTFAPGTARRSLRGEMDRVTIERNLAQVERYMRAASAVAGGRSAYGSVSTGIPPVGHQSIQSGFFQQ